MAKSCSIIQARQPKNMIEAGIAAVLHTNQISAKNRRPTVLY